jgi:hypothetical protein
LKLSTERCQRQVYEEREETMTENKQFLDVKRYTPNNIDGSMEEWEHGDWVGYDDYQALARSFSEGAASERSASRDPYAIALKHSTEPRNESWYLRELAKKAYADVGHTKEGQIHTNRLYAIANMIEALLATHETGKVREWGKHYPELGETSK